MTNKKSILRMLLNRDSDLNIKYLKDEVTRITSETFKSGDAVMIISNADESLIALPIGKYDLNNNESLEVIEEGIIDYIGKPRTDNAILSALRNRPK